ncbi:aspartate/glutamate racemase family protein [Agrobacterium sp. B1(2019)]|uniref:aspartate/glutamate racemase family protein n=1 Tax=Agrobacterium sp. B1(2019) TaxID=2607032 RepID=UPI0011ED7252|nr:aspartate/glutamate racemase family protein [Agrobacterium sp. B1(2019)]TZG32151.1 aspartate/glutamate racemase family protein [Agrobacterium sp. B1(2019)]
MKRIGLINPNTSQATTAMMTNIARRYLPEGFVIEGHTAAHGVPMILNEVELATAADSVVQTGCELARRNDALIVCAFGDPGLERLAVASGVPTVGICQASMMEAAAGDRRFGIATVTPDLVGSFAAKAQTLGVASLFTGTRLTQGDPQHLASDPVALQTALEVAARECFERDGADVVIIGGGPLGQAANNLQRILCAPIIAPIRSAVELVIRVLEFEDRR